MSERRDAAYRSRHPFLTSVRIGEGMVDMTRNLPSEEKVLLATTASLVVRETVHPDWIRLLLLAADRVHRQTTLGDPAGPFPSEVHVELPLSEQAARYLRRGPTWLERRFPFWLAGIADRLLLIVLPVATLRFRLFGWLLPMLERRERARIARWYASLRDIEQHCVSVTPDAAAQDIERLRVLRRDIDRLRDTPTLYSASSITSRCTWSSRWPASSVCTRSVMSTSRCRDRRTLVAARRDLDPIACALTRF